MHAPAAILSYGQRKLRAIAAAMMTRPKLVVLDEPVARVNPTMIRRIEAVIRQINAESMALLIVEHNIEFIMALASQVIVMAQGAKIAEGPPALFAPIRECSRPISATAHADADAPRLASSAHLRLYRRAGGARFLDGVLAAA